jgi:hypothetical protein
MPWQDRISRRDYWWRTNDGLTGREKKLDEETARTRLMKTCTIDDQGCGTALLSLRFDLTVASLRLRTRAINAKIVIEMIT